MKDFKNNKDYKDKGKKLCYMAKDLESSEDDEMIYSVVKDEYNDEGDKWNLSLMLAKMIHGLLIVAAHIIWLETKQSLST